MIKDFLNHRNLTACLLSLCFISSCVILSCIRDGVTMGKYFAFSFLIALLLIMLGLKVLLQFKKLIAIKFNKVDILTIAYGLYNYLNATVNNKPFDNVASTEFLLLIILYLLLRTVFTLYLPEERKSFYIILVASFLIQGLLQIVYGFTQLIGMAPGHNDYFALTGSFFNPGPYAGFLVSIFPFALVFYLYSDVNLYIKKLSLFVCIGIVAIMPFTMSRASWLALIIGLLIVLNIKFSLIQLLRKHTRSILKVFCSLLVISSLIFCTYNLKRDSAYGRFFMWKISSRVIKDNFLFGVGFNNYSVSFSKYQAVYFLTKSETPLETMVAGNGDYGFNELLELFVEQGLFGTLIILIALYLLLFHSNWLNLKNRILKECLVVGAGASIITVLIFSLFSYPFSILPVKVNLIFHISVIASLSIEKTYLFKLLPIIQRYFISSLCVFLSVLIGYDQLKTFNAFKDWKMESYKDDKSIKESLNKYKIAYPILKNEGAFLLGYGQLLFKNKQYYDCITVLEEAKSMILTIALYNTLGAAYKETNRYDLAEKNLISATCLMPYKIYPKFALANFYSDLGKDDLARRVAKEVVDMRIKVPSESVDMMKREMRLLWEDSAR